MTVKVKYHDKELHPIKWMNCGDWLDLRAAEDVEMKAGEFRLISLGVSMQLPEGYEAHIVPRSSTFKASSSDATARSEAINTSAQARSIRC